MKFSIYCADVGSIKNGNFGWAAEDAGGSFALGTSITEFTDRICIDLRQDVPVALGFECPLFIPVERSPSDVLKQREGEEGRPWAAASGASSLVTGLAESFWVLRRIHAELSVEPPIYFSWSEFQSGSCGLLLWEAFVTKGDKVDSHEGDAAAAVRAFTQSLPDPESCNAIRETSVFSLIAASALRAGWKGAAELIGAPCLVLRPQEDLFEAVREKGEKLAWQSWDSDGPGAGAGVVELWEYEGRYFVYDDTGMSEYDDPWKAIHGNALDIRTDATVEIWLSEKLEKERE